MATKWKETKQTEIDGLLYIQKVLNDTGCVFNKIDGSIDIGLDGYIEFTEKESATGLCIGVQVKSGNSYQNRSRTSAKIKSDKTHFEYWARHILPIAAIVYIPSDNQAYWLNLTALLISDEQLVEKGPFSIEINKKNVFDTNSFKEFHDSFSSFKDLYNQDWNFGRSLKQLVHFRPFNERMEAIRSLFNFHRNQKDTWNYLIQQFRVESDREIQGHMIFIFAHFTNHGDIFWHKNNIIDHETRVYAAGLVSKYFAVSEIEKLIPHIDDENGIGRGSFGRNAFLLIDLIPNKVEFLKQIIMNPESPEKLKYWSAIIIINTLQYYDLERAINFATSMRSNFPGMENIENFFEIERSLIEFQNVDFTG